MVRARTEVIAGEGLVVRQGGVVAWVAPEASERLVAFLVGMARQLAADPEPGRRLTDQIESVLVAGDPEPATAFAVVATSAAGGESVVHGPAQLWDGTQWVLPQPAPGWLHCSIQGNVPVVILPAGAAPPPVQLESPLDLRDGVVNGRGVALVPGDESSPPAAARATATAAPAPAPAPTTPGPAAPGGPSGGSVDPAGTRLVPGPGGPPPPPAGPRAEAPRREQPPAPVGPAAAPGGHAPGPAQPAGGLRADDLERPGAPASRFVSVDLRSGGGVEPRRPLPVASAPAEEVEPTEGVTVSGIRCARGHFNHPHALYCSQCGIATTHQTHVLVRGIRPTLGVLVLDDGSTFSLDGDYVVGSNPEADDRVRRGEARPLRLDGPADRVAPVHADIRLAEWNVQVVDRASGAGSYYLPSGAQQWLPLTPGIALDLLPDTHVALGQRVFVFESHLRN